MSSWCCAPSADDFGSLMESTETFLLFVAFYVVVSEKGTNFWWSQPSGFGPGGPCLTPAFLLTQAIYAFKDGEQDEWDGFWSFFATGVRVVAPGAAFIVARQQWPPTSGHQVALGLAGTVGLPSAVCWPHILSPIWPRYLLATCDCCRLLVSHHGVSPATINQTWWGTVLRKGVDSCVLLVLFFC